MGSVNLDNTGSGSAVTLSSDGTSLLLDGTAIGGGGGADLYAANESSPSAQPSATGTNSIAIGNMAVSTASDSFAGPRSRASGTNSFAVACNVNTSSYGAQGVSSISLGQQSKATVAYSLAQGYGALATNASAIALGRQAEASGLFSICIGNQSTSSHQDAIVIGDSVESTAANQVSLGGTTDTVRISESYTLPTADGTANQVLTTDGSGAVTFATAGGGGTALELYAENPSSPTAPSATGTNAFAIGSGANAIGQNGIALGNGTSADGANGIALGFVSDANGSGSVAIGFNADADGAGSVAIGQQPDAGANYSVAIGASSAGNGAQTITGAGAVALGGAYASGTDSFAAAIANSTSTYGASYANAIAMGKQAKAAGTGAIAIGRNAQASATGAMSFCSSYANYGNVSSGSNSVTMGDGNLASATSSMATGYGSKADIQGKCVHANGSFSDGNAEGSAQRGAFVLRCDTTDATSEALRTSNGSASTTNQVILPNNSAFAFSGTIVARQQASQGTASAAWKIEGLIRREGSAGTTVLVNSATTVLDNTPAWGMALTADVTNGGLAITVTGAASTNIRWVSTINTSEVTY